MANYTYKMFCENILTVLDNLPTDYPNLEEMKKKCLAFYKAQSTKAEYASTHKKNISKVSQETLNNGKEVLEILSKSATPLTGMEIAAVAGKNWKPIQVSTYVKFVPEIGTTKVVRETVNAKGLTAQKEYTAYFIKE